VFDGIVHDAERCGVVEGNGRGRLVPAEFQEGVADGDGFFAIYKGGGSFCLRCGQGNVSDDAGGAEDGAIVDWWFGLLVAEVKMATGAATAVRFIVVPCVAVDFQEHVAGLKF